MNDGRKTYLKLRASSARMGRTWFEAGKEPSFVTYADGKLAAVNLALCQQLGINEDEQVAFPDLVERIALRASDRHACRSFFEQTGRFLTTSFFPLCPGLRLMVTPFPSEDGALMLIWRLLPDESPVAAPAKAEPPGDEGIARFAGGIAHDFKNYLTTIIGNLSLVEIAANDVERRNCIQDATEAALAASDMAKELMGLSGRMTLTLFPQDSMGLLKAVERKIRPTLPFNVEMTCEGQPGLWPVLADRLHLERVFMNLCVNAIRAMSAGGRLTLSARNLSSPAGEDHLEFLVIDEGVGMAEDITDRIFEPYFSTKPSEHTRTNGLGLLIAKNIVQGHGGTIKCESVEGEGTTFRLILPRAEREAPPARKPGEVGKLLIVDDEKVLRTLTSDLLQQSGYEVLLAGSGEEALDICTRNRADIDLVMLDLKMPVLSGAKVCRLMRERGIHVPVIVCTGFRDHAQRFEEEAGEIPAAMIMKPYDLESLLNTVARVLGAEPR